MKQLEELINTKEPGWELVKEWIAAAKNPCRVLEADKERAAQELVHAQVTTRSPMGAIIYETGGILINDGWLRILGSGHPELDRGLAEWNKGKSFEAYGDQPAFYLVADDVIGGYFAINGGALGDQPGNVYYLAQDTLEWEDLGCGYSGFVNWALCGDVHKFYATFKWRTWKTDLAAISGNETFAFYPFLWTRYEDINDLTRKAVSADEHFHFTMDMMRQLGEQDTAAATT
ncbi:hypothetical protein A8C56_03630 [Niabella ginsenosidivorans]|uniref:DUF2625 domain-containing protein n=1 Tax=Niabella ginsenosidivorans TaxID=1176587 RepID=A0A1A9I0D4_9BACT|nr:DUF2625 domain-containing protein [Niabella ginsenosidivorans]ANH80190.1 hypothetical protein A8C56_03630 [Niabella ginsenosidivorans]